MLPRLRCRPEFDGVEFIPTEELMRRQGISGPQGLEFWKQCPWAGDDEESRAFRRAIEEHCW
jgi:hypothetical protein